MRGLLGEPTIFLVSIPFGGATIHLPFLPLHPLYSYTPNTPYFSGTIFGKYQLFIYLFGLTFSLRPDEVATVWSLQKPVSEELVIALFKLVRS